MINHEMKDVIFIGGWNSNDQQYHDEILLLKECSPEATVRRFFWESNTTWEEALQTADGNAANDLCALLNQFSSDNLKKCAVVGHSLGARIAVNAVGRIDRKLGELIIMGTAIDYDSPSVAQAADHIITPVVNLYSTSDLVLKFYQWMEGTRAFGSQGAIGNYTIDIQAGYFTVSNALQVSFGTNQLSILRGVYGALPHLIANYVVQSHCVYEYLKAWLDYIPDNVRLVRRVDSLLDILPQDSFDNVINSMVSWYRFQFPECDQCSQEEIRSMVSFGNMPRFDPLRRIGSITLSIHQISIDLYDWNGIIETSDSQGNSIQVSMNFHLNRDRDFIPRPILNEFLAHSCQYLDYIIYSNH